MGKAFSCVVPPLQCLATPSRPRDIFQAHGVVSNHFFQQKEKGQLTPPRAPGDLKIAPRLPETPGAPGGAKINPGDHSQKITKVDARAHMARPETRKIHPWDKSGAPQNSHPGLQGGHGEVLFKFRTMFLQKNWLCTDLPHRLVTGIHGEVAKVANVEDYSLTMRKKSSQNRKTLLAPLLGLELGRGLIKYYPTRRKAAYPPPR